MAQNTIPVFVVGSGRCGTRTIFKMLSGLAGVEVHHEFVCTQVQKLGALYYMGRMTKDEVKKELRGLHLAGVAYSDAALWLDSSNKLSWIIEPLIELFPNARFLSLVRDGRKVTSSFFYKLGAEMYDDRSTAILTKWLANPDGLPPPPPEKKYWWNIPQAGQPFVYEFPSFHQYQRVCYHWSEVNRVILQDLERFVPREQQLIIRLEDLVSKDPIVRRMLEFIGVDYNSDYSEYLKTPQNIFFPIDFNLTKQQTEQFWAIARPMMQRLGYEEKDVYTVNY